MRRQHASKVLGHALRAARRRGRAAGERGMATAEYAVVTVAACAFAGILVAIAHSPQTLSLIFGIIKRALTL